MPFDPKACLGYLADKTLSDDEREVAADSLIQGHETKETADLLLKIILDNTESNQLRLDCAESLGSVWATIGINQELLAKISQDYLAALMREYKLCLSGT